MESYKRQTSKDGARSSIKSLLAQLFCSVLIVINYLAKYKQTVSCGNQKFNSADLMDFTKQQGRAHK
ncbi:hypothetical protein KY290_028447 [Solanum tuberosum]|uniref:Uncharacterized protein n=1 Tax=Solanum tuberosum TaxID=4113 RepID=A0ABQ7UL24_SOLTU|nr:hypothetical protein KY290_028447 [Solanum tuberosum]